MKYLSEIKGMRNISTPINSKIFSISRTQNSSKNLLEMYVLSKEKERMMQEMEMLKDKCEILSKKITLIETKMAEYKEKLEVAETVQNKKDPLVETNYWGSIRKFILPLYSKI